MPGAAFFFDGRGRNAARLSFSLPGETDIERGIRCLGRLVECQTAHGRVCGARARLSLPACRQLHKPLRKPPHGPLPSASSDAGADGGVELPVAGQAPDGPSQARRIGRLGDNAGFAISQLFRQPAHAAANQRQPETERNGSDTRLAAFDVGKHDRVVREKMPRTSRSAIQRF